MSDPPAAQVSWAVWSVMLKEISATVQVAACYSAYWDMLLQFVFFLLSEGERKRGWGYISPVPSLPWMRHLSDKNNLILLELVIFICMYVCYNLPNGCKNLVENWQI